MRMTLAAAAFAALALAASGCTTPDEGGGHGAMGEHTYMLHLDHMPAGHVAPGSQFTVRNMVGGHEEHPTDHVGAHFWNATQAHPTEAIGQSKPCAHAAGMMPGTFMVTCTAPMEPGTYHLRAHARGVQDGATYDWWSDEETFVVA